MEESATNRFLDALAARDFEGLADCFTPDAKLRALVPTRVREDDGPEAIAERFRFWVGEIEDFRLSESDVEPVADRVRVRYRLEGKDPEDGVGLMEHHGYLTLADGRIEALNLVCSGFRPL